MVANHTPLPPGVIQSAGRMKTAKCKNQLSHMECGSRAAAFLVSDLFFQPIQREACRFDPMPRTFNHTPLPHATRVEDCLGHRESAKLRPAR